MDIEIEFTEWDNNLGRMPRKRKFVGVDAAHGDDFGAISEGYLFGNVFTVTKVHVLTVRPAEPHDHAFTIADSAFKYCEKCGEKRALRPFVMPTCPESGKPVNECRCDKCPIPF